MELYGIYLGHKVGIWETLWAFSIYHIATWTLWVGNEDTSMLCPYKCSIWGGGSRKDWGTAGCIIAYDIWEDCNLADVACSRD